MDEPLATTSLWDYRRRVSDIYAEVRSDRNPPAAWQRWRTARDLLFATHSQSPLDSSQQDGFGGLAYFDYDPAWRLRGVVAPGGEQAFGLPHSGAGVTPARRFGTVDFVVEGEPYSLGVYWLESYGGGVFLPFRDTTGGTETYGGGRYLLDTAKGSDLGSDATEIVLDFNFAYHPSCVHNPRWSCPLAPPENRLGLAIRAGERLTTS